MNKACLKIIVCRHFNKIQDKERKLFNEFILEGESFPLDEAIIETILTFNENEAILGIKVCHYELKIKNNPEIKVDGFFEIYLGDNIGYCFIDNIGVTFDFSFLFLNDKNKFENFMNNTIVYTVKNNLMFDSIESIKLKPNKLQTEDRANLLLINCNEKAVIEINNQNKIELDNIKNKIKQFSIQNSYQVCLNDENDRYFAYKTIVPNETFNFKDIYESNLDKINKLYDNLNNLIIQSSDIIDKSFLQKIIQYNKENNNKSYYEDIKEIIDKKYIYSKNIIEKELNREEYIDFIFKVIVLLCIYRILEEKIKKEENINKDYIKEIICKLIKNKEKIIQDKSLKIYEKIFLIIELFYSDIYIYNNEYEINYINLNNIEELSPLYYALAFLNQFIDELSTDSNFYYPLLLIDSGFYYVTFEDELSKKYISSHGFNMLPISSIKSLLKDLIPNILVLSSSLNSEDKGYTNSCTGLITINKLYFEGINIDKRALNETDSKHYAFIVVKILIHEIFGHKKSVFSKKGKTYQSSISFKDKFGQLKFLSEENDNTLFKDLEEMINESNLNKYNGDSGYLFEYFFGKIGNNYTMRVIDLLENEFKLGVLLDSKLWHNNISDLNEYIELLYIVHKYYNDEIKINANSNINEQIIDIKIKIANLEEKEKFESKDNKINMLGKKKERGKVKEKLNEEIGKKLKKVKKSNEILNKDQIFDKDNYTIDPTTNKIYINKNKWKYPYRK